VGEVVRDTTFGGSKKEKNEFIFSGFEGSQAVPARPSGRGSANNRNYFFYYLVIYGIATGYGLDD
jgi:hypothetical protein